MRSRVLFVAGLASLLGVSKAAESKKLADGAEAGYVNVEIKGVLEVHRKWGPVGFPKIEAAIGKEANPLKGEQAIDGQQSTGVRIIAPGRRAAINWSANKEDNADWSHPEKKRVAEDEPAGIAWELSLGDKAGLAEKLRGKWVAVKGKLIVISPPGRPHRFLVKVTSLQAVDANN